MEDQVSSRLVVANDDILMILVVILHSSAGDARMGGQGGHFGRGQMEQEWRTGDGLTLEDAILTVFVFYLGQETSHTIIICDPLVLSGSYQTVTDGFWT